MRNQQAHTWPVFRYVPVFRLLIPFLCGLLLNIFYNKIYLVSLLLLLLLTAIIAAILLPKRQWISGMKYQLLFLLSGFYITDLNREIKWKYHFSKYKGESIVAVVDDIPDEKPKTIKVAVNVIEVDSGNRGCKVEGKLLLYLKKDSASLKLRYGDKLLLPYTIEEIPDTVFGGRFNYKVYLERKQIYHRAYVRSNHWRLLARKTINPVVDFAYTCRANVVDVLRSSLKDTNDFAVASALLVGDDSLISSDLMKAYSASGTLHVLSVSGMHVGVIYLLIAFLFGKAERNKWLKHIYYPAVIILIWLYAILSGSSASVIRSATMLSIVLLGKWINSRSHIYNSLALSMFIILCYDPFLITDNGFILSYLAVYGIVYMQPLVLQLYNPENKWMYKIWELTAVSIAAQALTAPVSLLFFGQFPNYFILANMIVIPISTIAIYLTILQVVVAPWHQIELWVAYVNGKAISFVNEFVIQLTKIPGAVTQDVYIDVFQCLVAYIMIFSFTDWIEKRRYTSLLSTLICFAVLLAKSVVVNWGFRI
jgi:competence protein ComEC